MRRPTLSDTEKLKQKVAAMSKRIQSLEDALQISHASTSSEQHPLLSTDLLDIKKSGTQSPDTLSHSFERNVLAEDGMSSFAQLRLSEGGAAESYVSGSEVRAAFSFNEL